MRNKNGVTAFIAAALNCFADVSIFDVLLQHGADSHSRLTKTHKSDDSYPKSENALPKGSNALIISAYNGDADRCEKLIQCGLDPHLVNCKGHSALSHYGHRCTITKDKSYLEVWAVEEDEDLPDDYDDQILYLHPEAVADAVEKLKTAHKKYLASLQRSRVQLARHQQLHASLLFSDKFSDVVLVARGGECISAHRTIISARSEALSSLLQGSWAETATALPGEPVKIDMPQCAEALRALLRFIYLDEADAAQCASHLGEVLELAAMHDLPELGAACEQHAVKAVSAERLGEYVAAAELHGLGALRAACDGFAAALLRAEGQGEGRAKGEGEEGKGEGEEGKGEGEEEGTSKRRWRE